jgi:hypothetical protein
VPQDEGQHSLADAAEPDEQDSAGKLDVNLVIAAHGPFLRDLIIATRAARATRRLAIGLARLNSISARAAADRAAIPSTSAQRQ